MLWPWAELSAIIDVRLGAQLPFSDDQVPLLCQWKKDIRNHPVCAQIYHGPEKFLKVFEAKLKNQPLDYDSV